MCVVEGTSEIGRTWVVWGGQIGFGGESQALLYSLMVFWHKGVPESLSLALGADEPVPEGAACLYIQYIHSIYLIDCILIDVVATIIFVSAVIITLLF